MQLFDLFLQAHGRSHQRVHLSGKHYRRVSRAKGLRDPARAPHGKVGLGASAAQGAEAVRAKMQAKDDPRTWPEPLEDRGPSESGVGSREGQAGQGGAEVQGREAGAELCRDTFWRGWGLGPLAPGSRASFLRAARTATSVLMEPEKPARLCACVSL